MKKTILILIATGFSLMLLSLILVGFNYDKLISKIEESMKYEEKTLEVEPTNLNNIVMDLSNNGVKIVPTDKTTIKISYYETKDQKYTYRTSGDTFYFTKERKNFFIFNINFFTVSKAIIVEIPSTVILNLDVKSSNGKMEANDLNVANLTFKTSNGTIGLTNILSNQNISLNSSNGGINLRKVEAKDTIQLSTSNGRLELNDVTTNIVEGDSSNGKITFHNMTATNINMSTSNGSIYGSVIGINGDYAKYLKTSNGHNHIDGYEVDKRYNIEANGSKRISLKTSNGSIDLQFKK